MSRHWVVWWAAIVAMATWCALPGEALADTFTVTSSADASFSGPPGGTVFCVTPQPSGTTCTLRAAIQQSNALGGAQTITLPARTYTLAQTGDDDTALNGDLDITANITITGAGAATTIIQGCNVSANPDCPPVDRIFDVRPGGTLRLSGVTVRRGSTGGDGGGIQNRGTLALTNVVLDANSASGQGGGIEHVGLAATLTNVSVTNNQATFGAGIDSLSPSLTLTNVTLSGNIAGNVGGGLYQTGFGSPSAVLTNVTIAGNSAFASGGGIMTTAGTLSLSNTIVANNVLTGGSSNNCRGSVSLNSLGHNLVFPGTGCSLNGIGDQIDRDPVLGPLQVNGSQIPTHALLPGSAAIDAGSTATPGGGTACPAADARGVARLADGDLDGTGRCDIGAYELASFVVTSTIDADDASPGNFACAISTPGPCTLRAAIREANAIGGAAISLPAKHFTLLRTGTDDTAQNGDLDIIGGIIIQGAGPANTIVQACDADADPACPGIDRVFDVHPGGHLALSGVTVRNGDNSLGGGGILNGGTLILTNAVLDRNRTAFRGGGLANSGSSAVATLIDVSVTNNRAPTAAGIDNINNGVLSLTSVTVSGNAATSSGGGVAQTGSGSPSITLTNVTIASNTATSHGAGIDLSGGTITLRDSIVANNTLSNGASDNCFNFGGTLTSQGFNLAFPGSGCGFTQATDKPNQDPKLGALADHGGGMPTHSLLAGSAAIDAGNPAAPDGVGTDCAATDQRGIGRLQDGDLDGAARCDIGAFEARLTDLCVQRPPVQLAVTRNGTGGLSVTITAGLGKLTELDFHNAGTGHVADTNARIDIAGSSSFGTEFHFHRSSPQVSEQFTVTPLDATKPLTVPLDAFDACGDWPTFVGSGPNGGGGAGSSPSPPSAPAIPHSTSGAPPAPGEACAWFPSHAAAQAYLRANPTDPLNLDRSRNGIACEGADGAGFMNAPLDHVPVPRPSP